MLEGFSGTLVLVDELASGLSWMREASRRSPHRCLKTLRAAWHDLSRFALSGRTVRQRDYKQLFDFGTGARTNAVMSLLASI